MISMKPIIIVIDDTEFSIHLKKVDSIRGTTFYEIKKVSMTSPTKSSSWGSTFQSVMDAVHYIFSNNNPTVKINES